jgi:SAM-dependent methyltransferase
MAEAFAVRAGERDATLTHPFHAYPARLHPEVARRLLALVRAPAPATVLDPCCGSGTVLVEALAAGHRAVGTDLSPLAIELSRMKTRLTSAAERRALVDAAHAVADEAAAIVRARTRMPVPPGEARWFAPHTLAEVAALAGLIGRMPAGFARDALRMLLSSILVKVSRQASDSDPRLVTKHVAPGAALHFFARKSFELERCLAALAHAVPPRTPRADAHADDATTLATVPDGSVDAVITSPPYANTYDYVAHHARRYAWLGMDASALARSEIGAARWFDVPEAGARRFERELAAMCAAFARVLRPGGLAWVVIADGATGERALPADEALMVALRGTALELAARVSQARPTFDRTSQRAFLRRPKREHLLALRRR